jgi:hypothetical protein
MNCNGTQKKKKKKQKHECDEFLMFMYVINAAAVAYEPSKPLVLEDVEVAPPQVTLIFLSFHLTGRYASAWTGRSEIHLNATLEDFSMMLRCTILCAVFSNTFNKHFVSNMFCFFFLVYPVVLFCFLWV